MPLDDAGESAGLDTHWAVAVFDAADRRSLLALVEDARRQILAGTWTVDRPVSDQLLPLSSAYELAARERLDLFRTGHPNTSASPEQRADRARFLETGARRAFDLAAPIPLDDTDAHGILYHTLLLSALATVGGRDTEFRAWLALQRDKLFERSIDDDWATTYLRAIVELWTEVLDGAGPSGLDRSMEVVATIREERPDREREMLDGADEGQEMSLRFFFFALHHLTDAATELLLFRLHGEPDDVRQRLFVSLTLAGEATAGDARIHAALDWLYEAAVRVVSRRTPQLDLLPTPAPNAATRTLSH
ncbi:MAG TPA: hypothetical protein VKH19_07335 [Gemmatimonadaceae bacterium]|nr:hypothetical protein [Gemmatimonadaceae bacterium]